MNNVVSQSVPHLHVHVVPRTKGDGLRGFFWPRTRYADADEAAGYAARLAAALEPGLTRERAQRHTSRTPCEGGVGRGCSGAQAVRGREPPRVCTLPLRVPIMALALSSWE